MKNPIETLRKRLYVLEEREAMTKKFFDDGAIVLTRNEAKELLEIVDSLVIKPSPPDTSFTSPSSGAEGAPHTEL